MQPVQPVLLWVQGIATAFSGAFPCDSTLLDEVATEGTLSIHIQGPLPLSLGEEAMVDGHPVVYSKSLALNVYNFLERSFTSIIQKRIIFLLTTPKRRQTVKSEFTKANKQNKIISQLIIALSRAFCTKAYIPCLLIVFQLRFCQLPATFPTSLEPQKLANL